MRQHKAVLWNKRNMWLFDSCASAEEVFGTFLVAFVHDCDSLLRWRCTFAMGLLRLADAWQ